MWKNVVETQRPHMTILHGARAFACWIIDTHSEYVMFIASARQQCVQERVSMLRSHAHCLSFLSCLRAIRKEIGGKMYL